MKLFPYRVLLLILLSFPVQNLFGSHNLGNSMYMECIGTCTVRVHLETYRDCSGSIILPSNVNWATPLDPSCSVMPVLADVNLPSIEITAVCASFATLCSSPMSTFNGAEYLHQYRDYTYCSQPATCSYRFSFTNCCRNGTANSIVMPGTSAIYVEGPILDVGLSACNNSPVWNIPSSIFLDTSSANSIFLGASDPDGDSLHFSLDTCRISNVGTVTYATGYSATQPFGPAWNVSINSNTGMVSILPNPGVASTNPICVRLEEWRGNTLLSTQTREIILFFIGLPGNNAPSMQLIPPIQGATLSSNNYSLEACLGNTISFQLYGTDPDPGQSLRMYWKGGANASFVDFTNPTITDTISGTNPSGLFTFTPPAVGQYNFTFVLQDDFCPVRSTHEIPVSINVSSNNSTAHAIVVDCQTVDFSALGCGTAPFTYQWNISNGISSSLQHFTGNSLQTGNYTWTCSITDANLNTTVITDSFTLGNSLFIPLITNPDTVAICGTGPVSLSGIAGMAQYQWSTADTTPSINVSVPGNYLLMAWDSGGCMYQDSVVVISQGSTYTPGLISYSTDTIDPCNGALIATLGTSQSGLSYLWSNGQTSQSIVVNKGGTYSLIASLSNGCQFLDTVDIVGIPAPIYGQALTSSQTALFGQKIYLIEHDVSAGTLTAIDSTGSGNFGYYAFCNVSSQGVYYVKAAPDSAVYPNEMPTYGASSLTYANAVAADPVTNGPTEVNITTLLGTNPGGPGFIGGLISQGANKTDGPGDPVPNVRIFLYHVGLSQVIGYRDTDANGYFSASNLPLGDYQIIADVAGVDVVNVPVVPLAGNQIIRDSLDFRLHSTYLEWLTPTAISSEIPQPSISVIPNPVLGAAQLRLELPAAAEVSLAIYDSRGRKLGPLFEASLSAGVQRLSWPESLPPGIYFLNGVLEGQAITKKVVVLQAQ